MTVEERAELYERLYKSCKAVDPVATLLGQFSEASPLDQLELLREAQLVKFSEIAGAYDENGNFEL